MKTIFWDEHITPITGISIVKQKSNSLEWFYILDNENGLYYLYHNVII